MDGRTLVTPALFLPPRSLHFTRSLHYCADSVKLTAGLAAIAHEQSKEKSTVDAPMEDGNGAALPKGITMDRGLYKMRVRSHARVDARLQFTMRVGVRLGR